MTIFSRVEVPRFAAAGRFARRGVAAAAAALGALFAPAADAQTFIETPSLEQAVAEGRLPPVAERLPQSPLVVDLEARGRELGVHGGVWRMLIGRARDVRYGVVYSYARLVGFNQDLELVPDILEAVEVSEGRIFTLRLRPGHRWSDGHPFTSEDFRYWWQDVANNPELTPAGPPAELLVNGQPPIVRFPDETTVVYEWPEPNNTFLRLLAQARPPFIYRPAHYMRGFHARYTDADTLSYAVSDEGARNWAQLHNRRDNMYNSDNPQLPTLGPWMVQGETGSNRFVWVRNPYYHRVDAAGRQLPYIDELDMSVASSGLIPAKTIAGEVDLQARSLPFSEAAVIKSGEGRGGYLMRVWENGVASEIAIFPNLNYADPAWREILRDRRFRRALSLGVRREAINRALYFELARPAAMSLLQTSPLYSAERAQAFAEYDPERANALLDEMGFTERNADGIRLRPDGVALEVVVETAGERTEVERALQFVTRHWAEIGVRLILRPNDRDILRNRVYAGEAMMAVWYGWDNGQATPNDPPAEQTPLRQDTFAWPMWGQYHQTRGESGQPIDMAAPQRLYDLAMEWETTQDLARRTEIWNEILDIHAQEVFGIGILNGAPQLVVVSNRMRNVPEEAVWSWDPGSHFGIHRTDEFFFAPE